MDKEKYKKSPVESLVFYTETHRLIKFYLNCFSSEIPAVALSLFLETHKKNNLEQFENDDNIETQQIDQLVKESYISDEKEKKIVFLEELRILVLATISSIDRNSKRILQRYHLYLHLFELSLSSEKSKYQKVHEFLESNFTTEKSDSIRNACRGNYGQIIALEPSLSIAIEEIHKIDKFDKIAISNWKKRHSISDNLAKALTGNFRDFTNRYDEYCYFLLHDIPFTFSDSLLNILDCDYQIMKNESDGWLKLIYLLTVGSGNIRDYEKCYEILFFETFRSDFLIGLDFLSFSRKCVFYFPYLLDSIPLNCLTVESLIRFAARNGFEKSKIVDKYSLYLQESNEFEQLCRFILTHGALNLTYTQNFMDFFIKNFDRFRSFTKIMEINDEAIRFIHKMSALDDLCEESIRFLLSSVYFEWYCEEIALSLSNRVDLPDQIILEAMNAVFELERVKGVSLNVIKSVLAKKLIK